MDRAITLPAEDQLLTRDEFRELCFARDGHACVLCGAPAADAHHIVERRLFPDGGYYLGNAASVCGACHIRCEQTLVSVEEVRAAAGITSVILPEHVYRDEGPYTKWLDQILVDGRRVPGELFYDESVQRVLRAGGVLPLYVNRFRYPRTFHVPFSPGVTRDDRVLSDLSSFEGKRVVISTKQDGESTTIYADGYLHARSVDGELHPSQSRARAIAASVAFNLPDGWRICGENLQAVHSIRYSRLRSYFQVFSIWNELNECLPWDDTIEWCALLGLETVPVIYDGPFDESVLKSLYRPTDDRGDEIEGWVMRTADGFKYEQYRYRVVKFVRAGHVAAHARHWRRGPIEENHLDHG